VHLAICLVPRFVERREVLLEMRMRGGENEDRLELRWALNVQKMAGYIEIMFFESPDPSISRAVPQRSAVWGGFGWTE
jgi:hypothetical protein